MILTTFLIVAAILIWAFRAHIFGRTPATVAAAAPARRPQGAPAVARVASPPVVVATPPARPNPDLSIIEWDAVSPEPRAEAAANPAKPATPGAPPTPLDPGTFRSDPLRRKLRDRYIQARFPGVVSSGADLEDSGRIITAVRHYFEEQKLDRADELLDIAIAQSPASKPLRLAQLELAFLRHEGERFVVFARDFRRAHPAATQWQEIARLGRAIAPMETSLFGDAQGEQVHDRYGPWPEMPNWLQASFDLTAEVWAADFHREMAPTGALVATEPQRSAA